MQFGTNDPHDLSYQPNVLHVGNPERHAQIGFEDKEEKNAFVLQQANPLVIEAIDFLISQD